MHLRLLLPLLLLLAPGGRCGETFTPAELKALFYADLGPAEIDVSSYPAAEQESYRVFRRVCARCHTLARAVNSPRSSRQAWHAYIFQMRLRSILSRKQRYTKAEARRILDFLVFDAKQRKNNPRFETEDAELQQRFARTIEERMRRLQEANPKAGP